MNLIISKDDFNKKRELTNYYFYSKSLSDDEIEKIKKIAEKYQFNDGFAGKSVRKQYRNSKIKWLPPDKNTNWLYKKLGLLVKQANDTCWGFDIVGFGENLQFGEYNSDVKGHYDWHLDLGKEQNWRKISMSIQLTDPNDYEGGDLQFYTQRDIITCPRKKGTIIFFPSYLLHKVTPVTKGVRNSLVAWVTGPPLR